MRKLFAFAILTLSSTAFAQGADKKAAEPPAAAPPAMAAPKPAPELDQLKMMIGVWKCDGKYNMGGMEMQDTSKAVFSWDMDKFFVAGNMSSPKTKMNPTGYKGRVMYGYDPGKKMFVSMSVDNMGGMAMATSKGWDGDKMEWTGKSTMMGKEMDSKETITKKGDREVTINFQSGSGAESMSGEMHCKK